MCSASGDAEGAARRNRRREIESNAVRPWRQESCPRPSIIAYTRLADVRSRPPAARTPGSRVDSDTRKRELVDAWPEWDITDVTFTIQLEREEDGRWVAEVPDSARRAVLRAGS